MLKIIILSLMLLNSLFISSAHCQDYPENDHPGFYNPSNLDKRLLDAAKFASYPEAITALVEKGADVNAKWYYGETPLFFAASYNPNPEIAKQLIIEGADPNGAEVHGSTPLIAASRHKNLELIKILVESGADLNAVDDSDNTALILAVASSSLDVVKYLVNNGADVFREGIFGRSMLMSAAAGTEDPEILKYLLSHGHRIRKHGRGETALSLAAEYNPNFEIIAPVLIAAGAEMNSFVKRKLEGFNPVRDIRANSGFYDTGAQLHNKNYLKAAMEKKAKDLEFYISTSKYEDFHLINDDGKNAMMLAAEHNQYPSALMEFLDNGAELCHKDNQSNNILYYANRNHNIMGTEVYRELKERYDLVCR